MTIPHRAKIKEALIGLLSRNGKMAVNEVHKAIERIFELTDEDKKILIESGQQKYKVETRWARQELTQEGIIDKPEVSGRGYWQLKNGKIQNHQHYADEIYEGELYSEGSTKTVQVNRYERNEKGRLACLSHHGHICKACGFDFESIYGPLGKSQIHVHHKIPISTIGKNYNLNPITDLIPVCPNCHHMIHRRNPPFSIEEIKAMIKSNKHAG